MKKGLEAPDRLRRHGWTAKYQYRLNQFLQNISFDYYNIYLRYQEDMVLKMISLPFFGNREENLFTRISEPDIINNNHTQKCIEFRIHRPMNKGRLNILGLPGFTAEASLRRTEESYFVSKNGYRLSGSLTLIPSFDGNRSCPGCVSRCHPCDMCLRTFLDPRKCSSICASCWACDCTNL